MKVTFVGCGDAFGSGGRFNTCIHVADKGGAFLLDCGATSLVAMKQTGIDRGAIDGFSDRQEREKAFDERWRTWSKTFFSSVLRRAMFAKEHPNSWVRVSASGEDWKLSPAAAREDLRAHSRMY